MPIKGSFRSRVVGGMIGLGMARIVALLTPIVQLPILLSVWKIDLYGAWITANALVGFPTLPALSILPALGAELAMRHGSDERDAANNAYTTAMRAILATSAILYLCCVGLFLVVERYIDWEVVHLGTTAVILLLLSFAISNIATTYATLLGSVGHYALGNTIEASRRTVELVAIAVGVWAFGLPPLAAAAALVVTASVSALFCWLAFRRYSGLRAAGGRFDLGLLARLRSSILGSMMLGVSYAQIFVLGPRLLIGYALGNAAVVNFSVTSNFVRLTRQVADLTSYPFQNEMSFAYGRRDVETIARLYLLSSRLSFWFAVVAAAGVLLIAPMLISFLSGGTLIVDPILLWLLAAALLVECASLGAIIFLISIGATLRSSIVLLVCGILGLIAAVLLAPVYGVNVFAAAILVVSVIYSIALWFYSLPLAGVSAAQLFRAIVRPPLPEAIGEGRKLLRRFGRS